MFVMVSTKYIHGNIGTVRGVYVGTVRGVLYRYRQGGYRYRYCLKTSKMKSTIRMFFTVVILVH